MNEGTRVLLLSDDDDVAQPLLIALRRAGHRVGQAGGRDAPVDLGASPPDALIVDRDIPSEVRRQVGKWLAPHAGRNAFPLIVLGEATDEDDDFVPADWHEDALLVLSRQAHAGEVVIALRGLLRLGFYRAYRELVHDLSQPVTVLHALSDNLARALPADAPHRVQVMRLHNEAERLLSLMERFQRDRAVRDRQVQLPGDPAHPPRSTPG